MAPPPRRARPGRTLLALGIVAIVLFGSLLVGTYVARTDGASMAPKLALDLEGGTQIVLTPVTENGAQVTSADINEAIAVIRQRVDSSGVAEATITSQGGQNIVVELPGEPNQQTIDLVTTSARMEFRPVLAVAAPTPTPAPAPTPAATPAKAAPDNGSDVDYYLTPEVRQTFDALDCTAPASLTGGANPDPATAFVTCDVSGQAKYVLGPVEVQGTEISNATSGLRTGQNGVVTNEWVVNLEFASTGARQFADVTTRLVKLSPPLNQFGIVLDGLVVSAPSVNSVIADGRAEISGSFTRETAATLANQLSFGALPLTFTVQSQDQISATLGSQQLQNALIAGLIGLVLVIVYSLIQYRVLGLLTIGSLGIGGAITYGLIALLSWLMGYRLSLAGVAGLIVAIGITADSFIVYFERIRDELREGRTLGVAVDRAWVRARRTIVASDTVNFLAAVVLYFLAVGGVRGFAFTLGLTTLVDLLVVFTFTHPMMEVISRHRFFAEGHAWSGLDPRRLGVVGPRYAGRGRVAVPVGLRTPAEPAGVVVGADLAVPGTGGSPPAGSGSGPAIGAVMVAPGATIAERRAAARAAREVGDSGEDRSSGADEGSEG